MAAALVLSGAARTGLGGLIPAAHAASYFEVNGLLVDDLKPKESDNGRVFRVDIRQMPLIESRRQPVREKEPPPDSAGIRRAPLGRAMDRLGAADLFVQDRDWNGALAEIEKGLEREPANILLVRRAAAYAAMARRYAVADEYFRQALEADPDDVPFLSARAGILLRLLRLDEAGELADRALALAPDDLAARLTRTGVRIARGDDAPDDQAWNTLTTGEAAQIAEWLDADRADYIEALSEPGFNHLCESALGPGTFRHLPEIARLLKQAERALRVPHWADAVRVLEEAHTMGVHAAGVALDIARGRFETGDIGGAERMFRAIARRFPDLTMAQYDHAVALVRMERFAEAQGVLENAHDKNPASPEVIFGLACAHAAQGDMESAWRVLERLPAEFRPRIRGWVQGEEPYIRAIREDTRFEAFVRSAGG